MCGIVGYLGSQEAVPNLIDCLGRLEYRGYDSAGIGTVADGKLDIRRSVGKNSELHALLARSPLRGTIGIAHTRWATHGKPIDINAHPHTDCTGSLAIVHNGIIENYHVLRRELEEQGHRFNSQTDSEVIAHLLEGQGEVDLETAARQVIPRLQGAYALAVISQKEPDRIVAARNGGPPLVIGHTDNGYFVASDITAIMHYARDVQLLEDGEIAVISRDEVKILGACGTPVQRPRRQVQWTSSEVGKSGYAHYMLKEIFEQPQAVLNTVQGQRVLDNEGSLEFPDAPFTEEAEFAAVKRVSMVACGTSWHAALVGKYLMEFIARTPVDVDIASEYRYRPQVESADLVIGISQSGETADTLGALKEAKNRGSRVLSICNVAGSSMSRDSDGVIYTHAGPEIGVASTKAFTCQLTALLLLALKLGRAKGTLSAEEGATLLRELLTLPRLISRTLEANGQLEELARRFEGCTNALYLGRGIQFPLAIEGALKLKEISYIHAEGYPAGELKHGPIALIEKQLPVIVIAPLGRLYGKVVAAIEEVKARDGMVIALASEDDDDMAARADHVVYLPKCSEFLMPILAAVPLQLLAYHIAVQRGCDVDKPRNLAKSVTVE